MPFYAGSRATDPSWDAPPSAEEEEESGVSVGDTAGQEAGADFLTQLQQEVRSVVSNWAKEAGYSANAAQAFVNSNWSGAYKYFSKHRDLNPSERTGPWTIDTFNVALDLALSWYGARLPFSIDPGTGGGGAGGGRRGGGGGGGPRKPTPDEIRAQFDINALADRVNSLSRTFLIQDHNDPRVVARAYVESIVKNPEQELDFDTFVKGQLKRDSRWNIIMQNKPNGMDEAMYIQRYVQQVQGFLGGGDEATQIAFEQAALGSGSEGVQGRLGRTREARSSSNFVNSFEDSIRNVSELLQ